jgi:hypothetical protein
MPLSCHKRPKTKSGPSLRTATGWVSPAAWASKTAKPSQWRTPRAHEPIQLAALLQYVEPAQGGNDLLTDLFAFPDAVGNLQVTVGTGGFDAEEHGVWLVSTPSNHIPCANAIKNEETGKEFALHFGVPNAPIARKPALGADPAKCRAR